LNKCLEEIGGLIIINVYKAESSHVEGIKKVCSEGYWATYEDIYSKEYIEKVIKEFYNKERILDEVTKTNRHWGGYFVAVENEEVIGAGGGGMIGETEGEIFVLYLNPKDVMKE
jgi:hypothetical protein